MKTLNYLEGVLTEIEEKENSVWLKTEGCEEDEIFAIGKSQWDETIEVGDYIVARRDTSCFRGKDGQLHIRNTAQICKVPEQLQA